MYSLLGNKVMYLKKVLMIELIFLIYNFTRQSKIFGDKLK